MGGNDHYFHNSERTEIARSRLDQMNADCFGCSASLLLDLRSAALDMIDHGSLDDKLRNGIDISGTVLD